MKKLLVLTLVLVAASTANAQLNLFYDVRPTIAAIDNPVAPFTHSASLCPYAPYIGKPYPLQNTGHRGDGQNVYISPKIHDSTDWTGYGPPDLVDENISTINPAYDWAQADAYLYAAFFGNASEVVSSIGIDAALPAAAFTPGGTFWLASATTTALNTNLWSGYSITGGNASTSMRFVEVPVVAGPAYDANAGIHTVAGGMTSQIAKLHLVADYKVGGEGVGVYNLFLSENALKITRVANPGPAAALPFNFGYAAGVPEPGTSNATPDLVVTVVRKGDFDWDGAAATGVDDYAYYSIGADPTLVNPVEFWLGDFDLDGAAFTGLDDYDYYKHANVP